MKSSENENEEQMDEGKLWSVPTIGALAQLRKELVCSLSVNHRSNRLVPSKSQFHTAQTATDDTESHSSDPFTVDIARQSTS